VLKCLGSLNIKNVFYLYKEAAIYSPNIFEIYLHLIYNKCDDEIYFSIYKRLSLNATKHCLAFLGTNYTLYMNFLPHACLDETWIEE
jgi:hypothetical protein